MSKLPIYNRHSSYECAMVRNLVLRVGREQKTKLVVQWLLPGHHLLQKSIAEEPRYALLVIVCAPPHLTRALSDAVCTGLAIAEFQVDQLELVVIPIPWKMDSCLRGRIRMVRRRWQVLQYWLICYSWLGLQPRVSAGGGIFKPSLLDFAWWNPIPPVDRSECLSLDFTLIFLIL